MSTMHRKRDIYISGHRRQVLSQNAGGRLPKAFGMLTYDRVHDDQNMISNVNKSQQLTGYHPKIALRFPRVFKHRFSSASDGNPMDPTQRLSHAPRCRAMAKRTGCAACALQSMVGPSAVCTGLVVERQVGKVIQTLDMACVLIERWLFDV